MYDNMVIYVYINKSGRKKNLIMTVEIFESKIEINQWQKHLLADLKSIPVKVPAATVLMSSSAPLAFSITTPNTLYNKAVEAQKHTGQQC